MKNFMCFSMIVFGLIISTQVGAVDNCFNNEIDKKIQKQVSHSENYYEAFACLAEKELNIEMINELALEYETFISLGNTKEEAMIKIEKSLNIIQRREEFYNLFIEKGYGEIYAQAFVDLLEEEEASEEEAGKFASIYKTLVMSGEDRNIAWSMVCNDLELERNINKLIN